MSRSVNYSYIFIVAVVTFRPSNVVYSVLIGWWLSLIYILIAGLMFLTIIGKDYGMGYNMYL